MTLTFFVETGSPSRFLNCCDLCVCEIREAVAGGGRSGMAVEKDERGRAVLLYTEAACLGFLERQLASWLELGGKAFSIFRWGFPTVLNLYS